MTNIEEIKIIILKVIVASFGTVGIVEYLKNFIKTEKKWIYSIIMPFVAVGSFYACEILPIPVIGSILTIGSVQLDYQIIVQGFKKTIEKYTNKIGGNDNE